MAFLGRAPTAAHTETGFALTQPGNSDGDLQMLQWTAAGAGRRLMLLVDHTDAEREFGYRISPIGRLEVALQEAQQRGWTVVSMKDDWKPFSRPKNARNSTRANRGNLLVVNSDGSADFYIGPTGAGCFEQLCINAIGHLTKKSAWAAMVTDSLHTGLSKPNE